MPNRIPKINVAWYPVIVTFLAQGDGPYRLLFGNANKRPLHTNLPKALSNNPKIVKITMVNAIQILVDTTSATPHWLKALNWQKTLLGLILFFCVALMATMAYKLYLSMNK